MATVVSIARKTVVPQTPPIIGVTLELTVEEAITLVILAGNIGGTSHSSRRGHTDAIRDALTNAGIVKPQTAYGGIDQADGTVYFKEGSRYGSR